MVKKSLANSIENVQISSYHILANNFIKLFTLLKLKIKDNIIMCLQESFIKFSYINWIPKHVLCLLFKVTYIYII